MQNEYIVFKTIKAYSREDAIEQLDKELVKGEIRNVFEITDLARFSFWLKDQFDRLTEKRKHKEAVRA